jgi:hypothetical protein
MDHDLIDRYLAELRRALRWRDDLDDVCAELEDHLRENVERLVASGVDPAEAQRRTLECFGDLGLVARSFAVAPSGGLAVPTKETRWAGALALSAAGVWITAAAMVWIAAGPWGLDSFSLPRYLLFAATTMLAAGTTTVALFGLTARAGRQRSWAAVAVLVVGALGTLTIGVMTWAWAIVGLPLTAAAILALRGLRALRLGQPLMSAALVVAWPLGAAALYLLDEVWRVGPIDEYGDHPLAFALSFSLAAALFALGLAGYGRQLAAEEPAVLPAPTMPAPSAR